MPTLLAFQTQVKQLASGRWSVTIRTPLCVEASRPDIGWLTTASFQFDSSTDADDWIASVDRVTTPVRDTAAGLRRRLKDRPRTTERATIRPAGVTCTTTTQWGRRFTSATSSTSGLSFAPADLVALLDGCVAVKEGRPLADWLTENATEFAPYLACAGWLPISADEFNTVCQERGDGRAPDLLFDDENDEEVFDDDPADYDRWR